MSDLAKQPLSYFLQEQRATNIKQNDLITAQQQLIDLLAQLLTENGLGEVLDNGGVSSLVGQAKAPGLKAVLRTFGPTSAPMIWSGDLEDPISIEHRGVATTARIMSTEEAQFWNRILDLHIRIRKCKAEMNKERSELDGYYTSLQRYEDEPAIHHEDEAEIRSWIKQNERRCAELQGDVHKYETGIKSLNSKLRRRALRFMVRSNLREKEDPSPWLEEMYQNLKKLDYFEEHMANCFNLELDDETMVDLYDTEDEGSNSL
ncbi:hypothetical protein BKA65DRAFT_555247 [Rhexocercosporidium sp. MPI-PUGE-AT-0058]|nr:hypothetical protein BKA65DRAFT_555247 [Rhexocercosporidium sp. MPI-PUGE-AT-0058]